MVCARAECPSAPALVADAEGARPACARQPEAKQGVWSLSSSTTLFPKLLRTSGDLSSCVWVHWLCAPVSPGFSRPSGGRRQLCVGEHTNKAGKTLHYKGCCFHRLIPDFMVQGGDITKGDGTGGESIYGPSFPDEGGFAIKHSARGLLSMANCGKNTNNSQFFITFKPAPWLDGKHVVFGRVIEGIDSVMELALVPRGANDRPKQQVIIKDCGEVLDIEKRREAEELRRQAEREAGKTEVEKVRTAFTGPPPQPFSVAHRSAVKFCLIVPWATLLISIHRHTSACVRSARRWKGRPPTCRMKWRPRCRRDSSARLARPSAPPSSPKSRAACSMLWTEAMTTIVTRSPLNGGQRILARERDTRKMFLLAIFLPFLLPMRCLFQRFGITDAGRYECTRIHARTAASHFLYAGGPFCASSTPARDTSASRTGGG